MSLDDLCVTHMPPEHPMAGLDPYYTQQSVINESLAVTPTAIYGLIGHRPVVSKTVMAFVRLRDGSICIPSQDANNTASKLALIVDEALGVVVITPKDGVSLEGASAWINYEYDMQCSFDVSGMGTEEVSALIEKIKTEFRARHEQENKEWFNSHTALSPETASVVGVMVARPL